MLCEPRLLTEYFCLDVVELLTYIPSGNILPDNIRRKKQYLLWLMNFASKCPPKVCLKIPRLLAHNFWLKAATTTATEPEPPMVELVILDFDEKQLRLWSIFANNDIKGLLVS